MAKMWYAIVDNTTGSALSFVSSEGTMPTQQELDSINAHLVQLNQEPKWGDEIWDAQKQAMVSYKAPSAEPLNDRVEDILNDPDLPVVDTAALRTVLERHLPDDVRYYA